MIDKHIEGQFMSIDKHQDRLVDKYRESMNIYWSALLTINGLLLTFFSIDSLSSGGRWIILNYLLVGSCVLSLWLIVWNFRKIKQAYQDLGSLRTDDMPDVPEDILKMAKTEEEIQALISEYSAKWKEKDIKKAETRHKYMVMREKIFEWLLFAETILVLLIIFTNRCG